MEMKKNVKFIVKKSIGNHIVPLWCKMRSGIQFLLLLLALSFISLQGMAQTQVIPAGSFIVNMGVLPQTVNNGLKPYGMIYDIVKNYQGAVVWSVNPAKLKDGIDFSYGGIDYKGGTFIISAEYRTAAINARITYWQTQGVVGVTTTAPITVPLLTVLNNMPNWTLDKQNGPIAVNFFNYAGIPATAYGGSTSTGWKNPADLNSCDDLFIMPHADPTWATHSNLLTWNLTYKGGIWLGCKAGSTLEDMFNPAVPTQQTNFLSNNIRTATGAGPYDENALILYNNHLDPAPPYLYAYPADPMMQFMGTVDAAMQQGAELIYMPVKTGSWRTGTRVYVWDPDQADVVSTKSPGPAAAIVGGRGFDNPNRGRVIMEAAHNLSGTSTAQVAAQRVFFNFSYYATQEKATESGLSLGLVIPTPLYSGVGQALSFVFSGTVSNYNILWQSTCGGIFTPNATGQYVTFTPPAVPGPTPCIISVTLTDKSCPLKIFTTNQAVQILCVVQVTNTITNSCYGKNNGIISMNIVGGNTPYLWNWTKTGGGTGSGTGTTITGLSVGSYSVTVTSDNGTGCAASYAATITEYSAVSASATPSPVICYGAATGSITTSISGGTPGYSYSWTGGAVTPNLNGISAGTYTVTVTDSKGCTGTASPVVSQPVDPYVVTPSTTNVNCYGQNTGTITLAVTGGVGTITYSWSDGPVTQNRSGLASGTYTVLVTDQNGCTRTSGSTITQPAAALTTTANTVNVACNGGATGGIDLTVSGGTTGYTYAWSNGPSTQDITNLTAGNYSVVVTDSKGCTSQLSKTITQGGSIILSTVLTHESCPNAADGAIVLTATGGTGSYTYDWTDISGTSNPKDRTALADGTYTVIVTDTAGCTATTTVTITTLHPSPVPPIHINN